MTTVTRALSNQEIPHPNLLRKAALVVVTPHITHQSNPFSPIDNPDNSRLYSSFAVIGADPLTREIILFGLNTRGYDDVRLSGERIVFRMADPELQYHLSEHAEVYGDHFPFTPRKPELQDAQRLISGIVNSSKASYAESLTSEINQILRTLPDGNSTSGGFREHVAERI